MSFKACIFDLDGTLCDSVESIAWSANRALRDFGMREASTEQYKIFVGDGVDVSGCSASAATRRVKTLNGCGNATWNISKKAVSIT